MEARTEEQGHQSRSKGASVRLTRLGTRPAKSTRTSTCGPRGFLDSDSPETRAFATRAVGDTKSETEKAVRLYYGRA